MMGATVRSWRLLVSQRLFPVCFPLAAKTITLSPHTQRNYPELQKRLNGWLSRR